MTLTYNQLVDFFYNLILTGATRMPLDVYNALKKAHDEEENPVAKKQFEAILKNIDLAARMTRPICQDTGTPYFFIEVGEEFPLKTKIKQAAEEALAKLTKQGYLRPNSVDPFYFKNPGNNAGRYIPWYHFEIVEGDKMDVWYLAKGGGSEAPSTLVMSTPLKGFENLKRTVVETIAKYGAMPCPPVIIGVAVAAGADIALTLAKKTLLWDTLARNPDPKLAKLEESLLKAVNELEIGPHGFGGKTTALNVHVDYAFRHPATFAIAVITGCWATRKSHGVIDSTGEWEIVSKHYEPEEG